MLYQLSYRAISLSKTRRALCRVDGSAQEDFGKLRESNFMNP